MQYNIIVIISIIRFVRVFPVPVTAFKQIVETDISIIATATILSTGVPNCKNASLLLKRESISVVNSCKGIKMTKEDPALSMIIRLISGITLSGIP